MKAEASSSAQFFQRGNTTKMPSKKRKTHGLLSIAYGFLKIGVTAYGMAILQQIKTVVLQNKWLTRDELDEGLGMIQLYPGPIMFNLVTYAAYKARGTLGAFVATAMFILPSYLLMLFLSWIYFRFGHIAWVRPLFVALEAMVAGIIAHVLWDFAKRYINGVSTALTALLAFVFMLLKIQAFYIVLVAIVLGAVLNMKTVETKEEKISRNHYGSLGNRITGILITFGVLLAVIFMGFMAGESELTLSMFKIGAVAFGNGNTIMPLLQQEAVISHHWLTMQQFTDGIGFGQITPGPFLITSTFIGYKVGGLTGSIFATIGMFYPSFFYTLVVTEIYEHVKKYKIIQAALTGVLSAFTGMLLFVLISISKISLVSPYTIVLAISSFVAVHFYKINILWIFLGGVLVTLILYFTGIPLF